MLSPNRIPLYAAAAAALAFLSTFASAQEDIYTPDTTTDGLTTASPTSEPTATATEADVGLFPVGTRTYGHFDDCDCWVKGKVDEYISGDPSLYRVKWYSKEQGTTDYYEGTDLGHLLTVVNHAADFVGTIGTENPDDEKPQIYVAGTPVYYNFDDSKWYHGTITGFDDDAYGVTWSDGSRSKYRDVRRVRVMVDMAIAQVISGGDEPDVKIEIGTPVRDRYKGEWWDGQITEVRPSEGRYTVTWTDKSTDAYTDKKILKQIIDQGRLYNVGKEDEVVQVFPLGTLVYTKFTKKFCK